MSCETPDLLPLDAVSQYLQQHLSPVTESQRVALSDAAGKIVSMDIHAPVDVPRQAVATMDGYAFRHADFIGNRERDFICIGKLFAGHEHPGVIQSGECLRIMTGASIPAGADCVVMQEQVRVDGNHVRCEKMPACGDNINPRAADLREGQLLFSAGHRLRPADVGLLASLGIGEVDTLRPLRIALLSTGDELLTPGEPWRSGAIYDINRYTLGSMLKKLPVEVLDYGIVGDEFQTLFDVFQHAESRADVIISSGGVSVGDADYTRMVLEKRGDLQLWRIAMKPGKPFAFGHFGAARFFGLPGNPVSALVTFHQLVIPALRRLCGEVFQVEPMLSAVASEPLHKVPGRTDYQRGILELAGSGLRVRSSGAQGSALLTSVVNANCFIVLEQERGPVAAGEPVAVIPFDSILGYH